MKWTQLRNSYNLHNVRFLSLSLIYFVCRDSFTFLLLFSTQWVRHAQGNPEHLVCPFWWPSLQYEFYFIVVLHRIIFFVCFVKVIQRHTIILVLSSIMMENISKSVKIRSLRIEKWSIFTIIVIRRNKFGLASEFPPISDFSHDCNKQLWWILPNGWKRFLFSNTHMLIMLFPRFGRLLSDFRWYQLLVLHQINVRLIGQRLKIINWLLLWIFLCKIVNSKQFFVIF